MITAQTAISCAELHRNAALSQVNLTPLAVTLLAVGGPFMAALDDATAAMRDLWAALFSLRPARVGPADETIVDHDTMR